MPFKGTVMNPGPSRNPAVFGEVPGFPVGSRWPGRRELCDDGVHAPLSAGIHGRSHEGAFSVVLSGGYEDDIDLGYEFTYTGQGGQGKRLKGTKWASDQIEDQEWTRGNLALAISWRKKTPVRVIRGHTLNSAYAPAEGYRYDGLYTVEDANMKAGKTGFQVCLFRFVRCPNQLPLPGLHATMPMEEERRFKIHTNGLKRTSPSTSELRSSSLEPSQSPRPHKRLELEPTEETVWQSLSSGSSEPSADYISENNAAAPIRPNCKLDILVDDDSDEESFYMPEPQSQDRELLHSSNTKEPLDQAIEIQPRIPKNEEVSDSPAYGTSFVSTINNQKVPTHLPRFK